MDFEDKIKNINDKSYIDRRINQLKYLIFDALNLPKDNVIIDIQPRFHKSNLSERFTDVWNIDIFIDIEFIPEPVLEPHGLQREVQLYAVQLLGQGNEVTADGTVEVFPDEFGKIGQVTVGLQLVLFIDIVLDGVERIENKMPVHAGVQRLWLQRKQL